MNIDKSNKPITLTLLYNRSSANFKLERYKDTVEDCTEVLKLNETHLKALGRRAHSHFKLKEFEECVIDCEEVQRLGQSGEIKKLIEDAKFSIRIQKDKNNFTILNVAKSAAKGEIKKAFHKLSLLYHSDKHPGATAIDKKKLERKFQEITKAYNSLMSCSD